AARDHHYFPEQRLPAHRPSRILLFEAEEVDHLEPVDRHLDTKIRALLCHRSQWPSTMRIDAGAADSDAQLEGFVGRVRGDAEAAGREAGGGPAEGFRPLDRGCPGGARSREGGPRAPSSSLLKLGSSPYRRARLFAGRRFAVLLAAALRRRRLTGLDAPAALR